MINFCLFAMIVIANKLSDAEIIQVTYHRYFVDKIINLGNTNMITDISFRSCGLLCQRITDCAGFNFEKNYEIKTANAKTICKLQIAKDDEFPKSFFPKYNSSYYGKQQNPLKPKNAIGCDPIDPSLNYFCDKAPSTQQPSISCKVDYGNQSIHLRIQTTYKVKPSFAYLACATNDPKSELAKITDKWMQDWLCNILIMFVDVTKEEAFTTGLYRKSATPATDNWRYGSADHDLGPAPPNFYQNWYDANDGMDDESKLCVQMLSGAPYYFKWKLTSCEDGTVGYPICEIIS